MTRFPPLTTPGGRQAWALLAITGGCIAMTAMAAWGVWNVRDTPGLSFWLAIAAHVQVLVGLTGLAALLVKRSIVITRDGLTINDQEAAQQVADAAQDEADHIGDKR